jgi:hypothetical protein
VETIFFWRFRVFQFMLAEKSFGGCITEWQERRRLMHTFRLGNLGSPEGDLEAKTRFQ